MQRWVRAAAGVANLGPACRTAVPWVRSMCKYVPARNEDEHAHGATAASSRVAGAPAKVPVRAPAHKPRSAEQHRPVVEIVVPAETAGRVIGAGGVHIRIMSAVSGAGIEYVSSTKRSPRAVCAGVPQTQPTCRVCRSLCMQQVVTGSCASHDQRGKSPFVSLHVPECVSACRSNASHTSVSICACIATYPKH